jgi:hypothetical protein
MGVKNTKPTIKPDVASRSKRRDSNPTQIADPRGRMTKVLGGNLKVRWEWIKG